MFSQPSIQDCDAMAPVLGRARDQFVDRVRARRGARLTATPEIPFSRDLWMGEEALALGLVDAQCTIDHVVAALGASHLRGFSPPTSRIDRWTEQIAVRAAGVLQHDATPRPPYLS